MPDPTEGITSIRSDELLDLPKSEYQIIPPYLTTSGDPILIVGSSDFQVGFKLPPVYGYNITAGIFMPKDPLMKVSPTNPLSLSFVPGCTSHIMAKNTAILNWFGIPPSQLQDFTLEHLHDDVDTTNIQWNRFLQNYSRNHGISGAAITLADCINNSYESYRIENTEYFFSGTATISDDYDEYGDPVSLASLYMYLHKGSRWEPIMDPGFANNTVLGLVEFINCHKEELNIGDNRKVSLDVRLNRTKIDLLNNHH